jgi:sugar phosphate isomerase/epimerase
MIQRTVGVCSWSLQPTSVAELIDRLRAAGVDRVQLALDPVRQGLMPPDVGRLLAEAGLTVASGMMAMSGEDYSTPETIRRTGGIVPDNTWSANLGAARRNAVLARDLGLELVTFHAGFIPDHPSDFTRVVLFDRLRALADLFSVNGVEIGLETGQERAETLLALLAELDHPGIGVNFDPANMILYGTGDPVAALRLLAPHVVQIHLKDALPPRSAGEWGAEVPLGTGAVDWAAFFAVLEQVSPSVELIVEREAGPDRVGDIRQAVDLIDRIGVRVR